LALAALVAVLQAWQLFRGRATAQTEAEAVS
jgi:hypothetical protein